MDGWNDKWMDQDWRESRIEQFVVRCIHLLILFWIKRNYLSSGRSRLLYPCKIRAIKRCCNYRGISLLPITYKILSNILQSRLTPYADHQCGFRHNRSTTDRIFSILQILEKKWEYNGTVHHLFIDFKKAYDSVRREVLCNILIEFGIPMKLVRPIKMWMKRIAESG